MSDPTTGLPRVGMVGAGQLARMTHQAAISLGLSLHVLAAAADDGAALVTPQVLVGRHDDPEAVLAFADTVDVVTFDHEHVPGRLLRRLEWTGATVRPSASALAHAQDKVHMRRALTDLGVPTPAWAPARTGADVAAFAAAHRWPVVAKAASGGYDGRGVWVLDGPHRRLPADPGEYVVEEHVDIDRELAVLLARRPSGQIRAWPVVQTVQSGGICVEVVAPAPGLSEQDADRATELAIEIAERLDVTGVLAVELFRTATGGLLVNELAMRPHNSGHWTIEGSLTSQFEQHLRAVLDWPLGDPRPVAHWAVMANLLGGPDPDLAGRLPRVLGADPGVRVHLYGKGARPGRKLGHVTVCGDDLDGLRARAWEAVLALRGPDPAGGWPG